MNRAFSLHKTLRRASALAAVTAGVLLVGGCGGGGIAAKDAGPTTSTGAPLAAGAVLNLTGTEYSFTPSVLKAAAGKTTIRFTNRGAVDHDFVIDALRIHLMTKPGKTAEATVTLPPGTYTSYCAVAGHRQSGMEGTLTVS
jgi:plastocyanin